MAQVFCSREHVIQTVGRLESHCLLGLRDPNPGQLCTVSKVQDREGASARGPGGLAWESRRGVQESRTGPGTWLAWLVEHMTLDPGVTSS